MGDRLRNAPAPISLYPFTDGGDARTKAPERHLDAPA